MHKLIFTFILFSFSYAKEITDYKVLWKKMKVENNKYISIRSFLEDGKEKFLAVDIKTLKTRIFDKEKVRFADFDIRNSRYYKLLKKSVSSSLHNGGIRNGCVDKVFLTVDLCPSSKKEPFEEKAIKDFIKKGHKDIAFAVSGRWFVKNRKYINWIKSQIKEGNLNVIWINHTYTHFYNPRLPLEKNFLLKEGTNLFFEITEVEKLFIKNGIVPSIFIRFPGLVADYKIRKEVAFKYGLIAVGSDAWLAKGQMPIKGSIILIHGNKNEPAGIKIFEKLLEKDFSFGSLLEIRCN